MSKEQLFHEIIVSIANEYIDKGLSLDELVNVGNEGLKIAEDKYDDQKDFSFESYAVWWIRQRILQYIHQGYKDIHKHSKNNRKELKLSRKCGCFSCGSIFDATEVEDYIDDGKTALCPYCSVDSVIGDASGIELNPKLLNELNKMYF
jgi:RNA polymerase sigma factor (sigma-70 family)